MSHGRYIDGSYFHAPNKGAAIFFSVAFVASALVHAWQIWPLLELQNYHILGRALYYAPYLSPFHPGRVLVTFGFISAIVEALNGWGASCSANQSLSDGEMAASHALVKASLLIIFVAGNFVLLAAMFHGWFRAHGVRSPELREPLVTLYTSTALVLVRTIYRIVVYFSVAQVKFSEPGFGPISMSPIVRYEWFFYIFEAAVMLCNCALFNARHPRRFRDPRPFQQTLVNPFGLGGLIKGQSSQTDKFWEVDGHEAHPKAGPARGDVAPKPTSAEVV